MKQENIQITATQWNKSYDMMVLSGIANEADRATKFKTSISNNKIKEGRGAYSEAQKHFNAKFEEFKTSTLNEIKDLKLDGFKNGSLLNLKGDEVQIALNHKTSKK